MTATTIKDFYTELCGGNISQVLEYFLAEQGRSDIGHFNVFNTRDFYQSQCGSKPRMTYSRRLYYKISLIRGHNKVEYADKVVEIQDCALLFATPKIPYYYQPLDANQAGCFCVFTPDFLPKAKTGFVLDQLPVFSNNSEFVYALTPQQYDDIYLVFSKMLNEIDSDYTYKYDLLRTYVMELIHLGQKLKPLAHDTPGFTAAARISSLFVELLERQFPIETRTQSLQLRSAKDYATQLGVHVNHLNKVLKETTAKTTTEIIAARTLQEAKLLLKQTDWNISEIAYSLGFEEVSHFSNFFKKQTELSPLAFR